MIDESSCGSESVTELDLSRYPKLKTLTIGDFSFEYVNRTKLIGMSELESVVIGRHSFYNSYGSLYVKNCPKLEYLGIGSGSFANYVMVEIENVDALEGIRFGELNKPYPSFLYGQILELKSIIISQ